MSMTLKSFICQNGSAHTVCILGMVCECLNYSLELCGGVFLGPGQQFSLCLDLAMSSHLHAASGTVCCMFCCASQKRTRMKRMWLDHAVIRELLLRLPSNAWYHNGQNSQPAAWPPSSARQSLGETGVREWVYTWVMMKTFGVTSAISHIFCSLIILCLSGISFPFLN